MTFIIMLLSYLVGLSSMLTFDYFNPYFIFSFILMVTFIGISQISKPNAISIPMLMGISSTMIYGLLMGRNNSLFLEYLIFVIILFVYQKMIEETKKRQRNSLVTETKKIDLEKIFIPIISQLAIFFIIMLIIGKMLSLPIYLLISFMIVYIFSRMQKTIVETMFFAISQILITIMVFSFIEGAEIWSTLLYSLIISNNAILGFYLNKIKK